MPHVIGQSRYRTTLSPEGLDEIIAAHCQVRVIDAFVALQDLAAEGVSKVEEKEKVQPPYDAGDLVAAAVAALQTRRA